jgi:hypothetical protein
MYCVNAEADCLVRRGQRHRSAFPKDFAFGTSVYAGKQLDERRFARTIFADDRVNLAGFELKINVP